jgi:hypothetical protein
MRGCLFTLLLGAVVIGALVVFALPRVLEGMITTSLTTAGLQARETSVRLEQDDPLSLIGLKADRLTIDALDATVGDLDAGTVNLVLEDVDLGSRTAESVTGRLGDVATVSAGDPIKIPEIRLRGDTTKLEAVASIDVADVEAIVTHRVTAALGEPPTDVRIEAPNVMTITVRGFPVTGTLLVDDVGALRLSLSAPISTDLVILEPQATLMDLRAVRVAGDRLVLEGDVDVATLLG